jgi:hypothetical protein
MGFSVLFGFGGPSVAGAFYALPLLGLGAAIVVFPHQAAEMWQRDVELASMSRGALQFWMWCAVGAGVTGLCGLVLGDWVFGAVLVAVSCATGFQMRRGLARRCSRTEDGDG